MRKMYLSVSDGYNYTSVQSEARVVKVVQTQIRHFQAET